MPKTKEFKILAGSWFDRKSGVVKAVGDVVEFTDKQADVFGRRNLRGPDDAQPAAPVVDPALAELQAELAELQAELAELTKAKAAVDTELTELQKAKAAVGAELTKVKADLAKVTKA